jgi:hypothetical protein
MSASDGSKGAYRCHFDTIPITGGNELRMRALAAGTADPETAELMFKLAED